MAELYHTEDTPQHVCWDRKYYNTFNDQVKILATSKTVYVGNLSFFTTELQIHEIFSTVGPVKRIVMGLNSKTHTPCGFCFVEYYSREHAAACLKFISGTMCDERIIRCDMDGGFIQGRQYGRGPSGGQMRDERRNVNDPARQGALRASRPTHPANRPVEPPVSVLGKRRDRDVVFDDNNDDRDDNIDRGGRRGGRDAGKDDFGRDIPAPVDPMSRGLSAKRPAPSKSATATASVAEGEAEVSSTSVETSGSGSIAAEEGDDDDDRPAKSKRVESDRDDGNVADSAVAAPTTEEATAADT